MMMLATLDRHYKPRSGTCPNGINVFHVSIHHAGESMTLAHVIK